MKHKALVIKRALIVGRELIARASTIEDLYRDGMSCQELAAYLRYEKPNLVQSLLGDNFSWSILSNAVRYALGGSDHTYEDVPAYPGLIKKAEFKEIARRHQSEALEKVVKDGRNMKGLKKTDLVAAARSATIAKGLTPWCDEERLYLEGYLAGRGGIEPIWAPAASALNARFYKGVEVRSPVSVREAAKRYKLIKSRDSQQ